jgi:hypothetical protein
VACSGMMFLVKHGKWGTKIETKEQQITFVKKEKENKVQRIVR